VQKPVSKFAFQVHNLQRYNVAASFGFGKTAIFINGGGLYELNPVDPFSLKPPGFNP
jgi:hypothetical protein